MTFEATFLQMNKKANKQNVVNNGLYCIALVNNLLTINAYKANDK